jgi:hypothetical protein
MSVNINLFQQRVTLTKSSIKKNSNATADLYRAAMNLVMDKKEFNLQCPEETASLIVAKHYLRNGEVDRAQALINRNKDKAAN